MGANKIEVKVDHLGDVQFEVSARGHRVYCDQPAEAGGYDEGMTPPEFFLASLGACAGYYVAQYVKAEQLPPEGLAVRVTAEKAKGPGRLPARLADFRIEVDFPHALEPQHREGIKQAVEKCLILNTLLHTPRVTTVIAGEEVPNEVPNEFMDQPAALAA